MIDYTSRLVLAAIVGGGLGYGIHYFFAQDLVLMVGLGIAIGLASDSALRTMINVKPSPNKFIDGQMTKKYSKSKFHEPKPPKPKF